MASVLIVAYRTDPYAAFTCPRARDCRHRGRARVVDAAREDHVDVGGVGRRDVVEQRAHHRVPEHEARARPDVAAALKAELDAQANWS